MFFVNVLYLYAVLDYVNSVEIRQSSCADPEVGRTGTCFLSGLR